MSKNNRNQETSPSPLPNIEKIKNQTMLQKIEAETFKLKLEAQQEIEKIKKPSSSLSDIKNQTMLEKIKVEANKLKLEAQQEIEKLKGDSLNNSSEIKEKIDNLTQRINSLIDKFNDIETKINEVTSQPDPPLGIGTLSSGTNEIKNTLEKLKEILSNIPQQQSTPLGISEHPIVSQKLEDPFHHKIPDSIKNSKLYNANVPFYMYSDVYKLLKNNNLKIKDTENTLNLGILNPDYSNQEIGKNINEKYESVMTNVNKIIQEL